MNLLTSAFEDLCVMTCSFVLWALGINPEEWDEQEGGKTA